MPTLGGRIFFNRSARSNKMQKEIWKVVPSFEDYHVSNLGRVKSFKLKESKVLRPFINRCGYHTVGLKKNCSRKTMMVHRLVMLAFVGPSRLTVDHLNMDKLDNRLENLEYVSLRENLRRASAFKSLSSKYPGVCWFKRGKKWKAQIRYGGKKVYLGCFRSEKDASDAYEEAYLLHVATHEV